VNVLVVEQFLDLLLSGAVIMRRRKICSSQLALNRARNGPKLFAILILSSQKAEWQGADAAQLAQAKCDSRLPGQAYGSLRARAFKDAGNRLITSP
jgi:hypothetical protein